MPMQPINVVAQEKIQVVKDQSFYVAGSNEISIVQENNIQISPSRPWFME